MKRIVSILAVIVIGMMGVMGYAESSQFALYQIEHPEQMGKVYLFGSIHVADERAYPLSDAIIDAFQSSDALAVELNIADMAGQMISLIRMMQSALLPNGDRITNHLSAESYNGAKAYLQQYGLYSSFLDRFCPGLWYTLMESTFTVDEGLQPELGLDMYFIGMADVVDKPIWEIEEMEDQMTLLFGMGDHYVDSVIRYMISGQYEAEYRASLQMLYDLMRLGDVDTLREYFIQDTGTDVTYTIDPEFGYSDEEIEAISREASAFNAMNDQRNELMTETVMSYIESGSTVFVCVGMAHVVGANAILDRLPEGYTITRVA